MAKVAEDIRRWLEYAKAQGSTHLIVVYDEFECDDYPVHVMPGENVQKKMEEYDKKDMQKVVEVYSFKHGIDEQLAQGRVFNLD